MAIDFSKGSPTDLDQVPDIVVFVPPGTKLRIRAPNEPDYDIVVITHTKTSLCIESVTNPAEMELKTVFEGHYMPGKD